MINIRAASVRYLKDKFCINELIIEEMFNKGILREDVMRNILIREEYNKKIGTDQKQFIRHRLADKYCVSTKLVEKVVLIK